MMLTIVNSWGQAWFQKTYHNYDEGFNDVLQMSDSSYYFFGYCKNPATNYSTRCGLVTKTDKDFNFLWSSKYCDSLEILSAIDAGDGITCLARSFSAVNVDNVLLKFDYSGNLIWSKKYGSPGQDKATMSVTIDSGYIIDSGYSITDSLGNEKVNNYFIRTDSTGNVIWIKTYQSTIWAATRSTHSLADGSFLFTGDFNDSTNVHNSAFLLKMDSAGNILWTKTYYDTLFTVQVRGAVDQIDGTIIIAGDIANGVSTIGPFIIKLDSLGNQIWGYWYYRPVTVSGVLSFNQLQESRFIITIAFGAILFDSAGVLLNANSYIPNFPSQGRYFTSIKTESNGFLLAGHNPSGGLFMTKVDSNYFAGNCGTYNIPDFNTDLYNLDVSIIDFDSVVNSIALDTCILLQSPITFTETIWCQATSITEKESQNIILRIYPNPFSDKFMIESNEIISGCLNLFDLEGRLIYQKSIYNENNLVINTNAIENGVYIIQFTDQSGFVLFNDKLIKL